MSEIKKFMSADLDREILSKSSNNQSRRKYIRSLITKELLSEIFEVQLYTVNQAQYEIFIPTIGSKVWVLSTLCEEYGIKFPNYSESAKRSMNRRYETNIQRYGGAGNILSKGSIKEEKRNKTVLEKYGVDNVRKADDVKKKIQDVNLERYGVKNAGILFGRFSNFSNVHKKVSDYLKEHNVCHDNEVRCKFLKFNESMEKDYSPIPDIIVEEKKIVIEIYGDYWHCNPQKYKEMDIVESKIRYSNAKYAKDIWQSDKIRKDHIESFGYKVIVLWETDINNGKYEEILNDLFEIR